MSEYYTLDDQGHYIHKIDGTEINMMDEVAFMFDRRQRCLLGHGFPEGVHHSYLEKQKKHCLNGFRELVDDLVYFSGKFEISEINKIVGNDHGYVVGFYDRMFPIQPEVGPEQITKFGL